MILSHTQLRRFRVKLIYYQNERETPPNWNLRVFFQVVSDRALKHTIFEEVSLFFRHLKKWNFLLGASRPNLPTFLNSQQDDFPGDFFVFSDEVKGDSRNQRDTIEDEEVGGHFSAFFERLDSQSDSIISRVLKSKLIMCSSQLQQQKHQTVTHAHTYTHTHKYVYVNSTLTYIYIYVYSHKSCIYIYMYLDIHPFDKCSLFSPHQGDWWSRSNGWDRGSNCAYSSHSGHRSLEPIWSQVLVAMESKLWILKQKLKNCWFHRERMFFLVVLIIFEVSKF